jgi:hypothetical protein
MAPFLKRARAIFRRVADPFPLTLVGLVVLLGCGLALFYYGLRRIDLILLVIGSVGVAVGLLAVLLSVVAALMIYLRFRGRSSDEVISIECGFPAKTGFRLPRPWYLPLIDVAWSWVDPEAAVRLVPRRGWLQEEIVAARRGVVGKVVRRVEVGDIFGLCKIAFRLTEDRTVRFVPSVGKLKHIEVIRGMSGGDDISHPEGPDKGDPLDMRHYNPGDPIRFVLWKVFARSRKLVVRTPERAISPARQTAAFLVACDGDEPAAGAARVAVDGGALGQDWVLGADGTDQHARTKAHALEVLTRSAHSKWDRAGGGLASFLQEASTGSVGRAVVFVPAKPGPWIERVLSAASERRGRVDFVVCTDGIRRTSRRSWWHKAATMLDDGARPGEVEASGASEVKEVIRRLGGRNNVVVVDRVDGRVFTPAHLENLEAA